MQIRTSKPGAGNKFYITTGRGGYSICIQGSPTDSQCNVLANCVGYACGRFNEIIGSMKYPALNCNAENFIERAKSLGLAISQKPSPGAIMCWQKGATLGGGDGAGHVAIVERVDNANQVYTSESGYGSSAFWNQTRKNDNGRWGAGAGYTFRGFIVNPASGGEVPSDEVGTPVDADASRDQIEVLLGSRTLRARKRPETNDAVILGYIKPGRYNLLGEVDRTGEASNGYYWLLIGTDGAGNDLYIARGDKGTTWANTSWVKLHKAVEPPKPKLQTVTSGPMSAGDVKSTVEFIEAKGVTATVTEVE